MAASVERGTDGRIDWGGSRDRDGGREFWLEQLVHTTDVNDGPATVMYASGLPTIGAVWSAGNDSDFWAACTPEREIRQHNARKGDPHNKWVVRSRFSTNPLKRCQDENIEDPLLEPPNISGSFRQTTKIYEKDKDGAQMQTAAGELLPESDREFDANTPTVVVSINSSLLGLSTWAPMVNRVNSAALWGMAARSVKLSEVYWSRKIYGTCSYYYTTTFTFEINPDTFDRTVRARGTVELVAGKASLIGDVAGNPLVKEISAAGVAVEKGNGQEITLQRYVGTNFLTLGIPVTL